jgi:hypothetical protein
MPASRKRSYIAIAVLAIASAGPVAQAADDSTTSIQRESEHARALKLAEPAYPTREERLKAKPLDWRATSGKPTPRKLTAAEKEEMRRATVQSSEGGMPDPKADAEARKLHPDDWKPAKPAN